MRYSACNSEMDALNQNPSDLESAVDAEERQDRTAVHCSPALGSRQASVPAMFRTGGRAGKQKRKRFADGVPRSPDSIDSGLLTAIQQLIASSEQRIISSFESKFASIKHRIEVLEAEVHDRNVQIEKVQSELSALKLENSDTKSQLESVDRNNRANSLIFTTKDFGPVTAEENAAEKVVGVVSARFNDVRLARTDIQAAHRLQSKDTIICKFYNREVRDNIFSKRFELMKRSDRSRNSLFINESLTKNNRALFNELLTAKRNGKLYTVFTRAGLVYCKVSRDSKAARVDSKDKIADILRHTRQHAA